MIKFKHNLDYYITYKRLNLQQIQDYKIGSVWCMRGSNNYES